MISARGSCVIQRCSRGRWALSAMIGFQSGRIQFTDLTSYPSLIEDNAQRPREQRWMTQLPLAEIMTT